MKLVVVELPAKAKTIEKYLGSGHRVLASFGHVRDLPPKDGSVDPADNFAMEWQVSPDRSRQLKSITEEARKADTLILEPTRTARARRSAGTSRKCFAKRKRCRRTSSE